MSTLRTEVKDLTNGQLYDEWNEACWARRAGEVFSPEYEARLGEMEAQLTLRPAEAV